MPAIDPAWAGKVEFYELVFGTWTSYAVLVLIWERLLRQPLAEWRYVAMVFLGAGAFWVNHYFQYAPFWVILINVYTVWFLGGYWWVGIKGQSRSVGWKIAAFISALAYTVIFIVFEQIARRGVEHWGMHEFCWMATSYLGFVALILWRGKAARKES